MGIECGECERDLRGGHDPSCSRYRPCVCPVCLAALEDGDGYLWCREHGEVSPLENHKAIATITRLTAALAESEAKVKQAVEAETRACAEIVAKHGWTMTVDETEAEILARLDQPKVESV